MNLKNINWNLYKSFIAVYETRNFNRAAEILGISHSAVWQNIKSLGDQLGLALFVSNRKGVIPTADANNLYPTAKQATELLIEMENNSQEFNSESEALIKIGLTIPNIEYWILDYLKEFCTKYPKVGLEFYRRDIMELLGNGKLDFVIEMASVVNNADCKTINLFKLSHAFIASRGFLEKHGLTQKISQADFLRLPMISFHARAEFFKQAKIKPEPKFIIKTDSAIINHFMTKNSMGIGYYAKETLGKMNDPDLVEVHVENIHFPALEVVCGYNSLSRPARAFVNGLINFCKND